MLIKLFMVVALSLSVSCFAESGSSQSKQQTQSSSDTNQQTQSSKSDALIKKRDAQSTEDSDSKKKPPMIQYCKEHLC